MKWMVGALLCLVALMFIVPLMADAGHEAMAYSEGYSLSADGGSYGGSAVVVSRRVSRREARRARRSTRVEIQTSYGSSGGAYYGSSGYGSSGGSFQSYSAAESYGSSGGYASSATVIQAPPQVVYRSRRNCPNCP